MEEDLAIVVDPVTSLSAGLRTVKRYCCNVLDCSECHGHWEFAIHAICRMLVGESQAQDM